MPVRAAQAVVLTLDPAAEIADLQAVVGDGVSPTRYEFRHLRDRQFQNTVLREPFCAAAEPDQMLARNGSELLMVGVAAPPGALPTRLEAELVRGALVVRVDVVRQHAATSGATS